MGAAGKTPGGGGERQNPSSPKATNSNGGYGPPPHPLRVRPGQVYWPLLGTRRRLLVVTRVLADGTVHAQRLDGAREKLRAKSTRLLATAADGQGRFYRFHRYSRRRYRTWAIVLDLDCGGARALLCCPEWYPARPVTFPARLLPVGTAPGDWLSCTADLSAAAAGQLNLAHLATCADPGGAICQPPARD